MSRLWLLKPSSIMRRTICLLFSVDILNSFSWIEFEWIFWRP
jgi:hypothetical protein